MGQRRATRIRWRMGLLILGLALLPARVLAAPIFGASPRTQFFLGTALRSFGQFEKASGGGKELKVWTAPAIFSYALATDATLNLVVPYQRRHLETPKGDFDAEGTFLVKAADTSTNRKVGQDAGGEDRFQVVRIEVQHAIA